MARKLPRLLAALTVAALSCLSFVSTVAAERATVYLHNGGQASGEIVMFLPGDRITLDLGNGERVTFAASDVAEVRKESAPAATAIAAGPSAEPRPLLPPAPPPPSDPMNSFGFSLKLGLRGTVNTQTDTILDMGRTPEFNLGLGLNFGGDAFGWALEPGLSVGKAYFKSTDTFIARTPDATLVSLSLYTGPTYYLHLSRTFYLGLGVGVRGSAGFWKKGMVKANPFEAAARVPVNATIYLRSQMALVLEVGVGGGKAWWETAYLGGNGESNVFIADLSAGMRLP